MDQGLAAVLGASVGVIGTLGTAFLTYTATKKQVRDQGKLAHAHWLREARQKACTEFFIIADEASDAQSDWKRLVATRRAASMSRVHIEESRAAADEALATVKRLHHRCVHVTLAGPAAVNNKVEEFLNCVSDTHFELSHFIPVAPTNEPGTRSYDALNALIEHAGHGRLHHQRDHRAAVPGQHRRGQGTAGQPAGLSAATRTHLDVITTRRS